MGEEKDPDYELPVTDVEIIESDEEDEELEQLVKEALEELPAELKEGKYKSSQVISPVKVTLTPGKEGDEDPKEEILTLESDGEGISNEKPPGMWSQLMFRSLRGRGRSRSQSQARREKSLPRVILLRRM